MPLIVPSTPATIGPFTASSNAIAIAENSDIDLTLVVSGSDLDLSCQAYPDDSAPSGIAVGPPDASPISPVIVTAGPVTIPTTPPPTAHHDPARPGDRRLRAVLPGDPGRQHRPQQRDHHGTIPSTLAVGQSFEATNFQTQLNLPSSIVGAAAALGNSAITGDAVVKVDADGGHPGHGVVGLHRHQRPHPEPRARSRPDPRPAVTRRGPSDPSPRPVARSP